MQEIKDSFYLQGKDSKKESFNIPDMINFEWNMLYACNYRCPHCIFEGKWEEYGKRTVYLSVNEWMAHWQRIYDKYGRASVLITGGEPFIYPDFTSLVSKLSQLHYPINISTNGSLGLEEFVNKVDPQKVSITLSFQPNYDKLEDIIGKVKYLRKHDFQTGNINLCAYPGYLKEFNNYLKVASSQNEVLKVIPFYGNYNGFSYPESYNAEEKNMLGLDNTWKENVEKKGVMCAAGKKSALIFPDGKVARCGQIGERHLIGNIFDDNFTLLKKALPCDVEMCPCLKAITE
ncbi:MAG: radical SAM protein [Elusimicrobia bacterium]|nr:radical SAM protein [Candidatus Liberimonas magnetica]